MKWTRLCSPVDHMNRDEYVEEDEGPPLLLSSHPPLGKYVHTCSTYTRGYTLRWVLLVLSSRCLAVVGLQRCGVGWETDVCACDVPPDKSHPRWENKFSTNLFSPFLMLALLSRRSSLKFYFPQISGFRSVFSLLSLVSRSRVLQRKCTVSRVHPVAFLTRSTLNSAVHTRPVRPSAGRWRSLAQKAQTLCVATVCLGKEGLLASLWTCLSATQNQKFNSVWQSQHNLWTFVLKEALGIG